MNKNSNNDYIITIMILIIIMIITIYHNNNNDHHHHHHHPHPDRHDLHHLTFLYYQYSCCDVITMYLQCQCLRQPVFVSRGIHSYDHGPVTAIVAFKPTVIPSLKLTFRT